MSGHSKWAGIKHQKAIADARRGQAFTKVANLLVLAARQGGANPESNFKLRLAIAKAKDANMPNANIERAIQKGAGGGADATVEEILYEGYGPGGTAFLIEVATDNRNRAAASVRSTLSKHGGRMAESGSVSYQFEQKGVIQLVASDPEQAALDAIEAGASDIDEGEGELTVYTLPQQLEAVRGKLQVAGYEVKSAALEFVAKTPLTISDPKVAASVIKLAGALDELDDVAATHANFEIDNASLEQLS